MNGGGLDDRLPRTTATFLFSDVERHTELWELDPDAMAAALAEHEAMIREAVVDAGGRVVKCEGDAVMAVFDDPSAGVEAARRAQVELARATWPVVGSLRVRMGVHTGAAYQRDGDYFGPAVIRAARLCNAAHGGQIVASAVVAALVPATWIELGEYSLRGLGAPEVVSQLAIAELRRDFPPLRAARPTHDRLPHPVTSFIGRDEELRAIADALEAHRVVTLTGIGGSGKTRLAIEAARSALADFPDGVEFVDLAVVTDEGKVAAAAVAAVGLETSGTAANAEPPASRLTAYLARRRTLLVFDNCEHLIDAVATLVDDLVSRCDALRVVATSREPLRVADEQIIAVGSLDAQRDAVALFRDRAAHPIDDTGAVATICERLDGIPLAIELAAARTTHLTVDDISVRLDDRFRLLTGGRRRVERQQTLQATLDWSYDLLDGAQQALLRRLAVFAGPFTLEAAEGVAPGEGFDVLDTLGALVERSMVNHDPGRRRYRLLESVRLYAEQKLLAAGESATARLRHRDWFLEYVRQFTLEETFFEFAVGQQLLEHLEDLEAAVRWSIDAAEWEAAAEITSRLTLPASLLASDAVELWGWELVPRLAPGSDLAFHCFLAGVWASPGSAARMPTGEHGSAERTPRRIVRVLNVLADEAEARSDDVSVFARAITAFLLDAYGRALGDASVLESSNTLIEHALGLASTRPPSTWTGFALLFAVNVALSDDDLTRADALLTRAAVDSGPEAVRHAAEPLRAFVLHMLGDRTARDVAARAAERVWAVWALVTAGGVMALELAAVGDLDAARHQLSALVPELVRANRSIKSNLLIYAAGVAIIDGDHRRAARWLACASGAGGVFAGPDGLMLYRRLVPQVRDGLSIDERYALRDEGRSLAIDDALREVTAWH
jgi:predicted ATPase/class 3 adenylate cyclase